MADEDLGAGFVTITLDEGPAVRSAEQLADRLARALDRGAREAAQRIERAIGRAIRRISPAEIKVTADTSDFQFELSLLTRKLPIIEITVIPKVNTAVWRRMILAATAGIEIPIRVVPDTSGFNRAVRAMNNPTIRADVEPRLNAARLTSALSSVSGALAGVGKAAGAALGIASLGIAAAQTTVSIVNLTAALAPAAGILAALPAVILGGAAAIGALKLATAGVGDAFKAGLTGDTKAFEKAIKDLSPAAKAAAKEVRALRPEFKDLRNSVQDSFFKQFEGQITGVAKALGGPLKEGLSGIAEEFGKAAGAAGTFLQSSEALGRIQGILGGTETALTGLAPAVQDVLQGFLAIGDVVSQAFGSQLASGIESVGAKLGNFLFQAAESGKAVAWVDAALTVFAQLGDIIANVGAILVGVFRASEGAGVGLLNNVRETTDGIREFVESAKGAEAIKQIFLTLNTVASQFAPIVGAIATQLGAIAPALVPIIKTLGPAIVTAIGAVGPALAQLAPGIQALATGLNEAISTIADSGALRDLARAIAGVASAIAPVLPMAGQLVVTLGNILTPIIAALTPVIGALVGAIGQAVTALTPWLTVIGELIAQLGPVLVPVITTLAGVIGQLAPVISTVASLLGSVLGPILGVLPTLLQPFLDAISTLVGQLIPPLNGLLMQLQPALTQVSGALVQVALALAPVLAQIAKLAGEILTALMPLLTPLIGLIGELAGIFAGRLAAVLTGVVVPALNTVSALLRGDFSGAFKSLKETVVGVIRTVVDNFVQLPLDILRAVGGFGLLLVSAGEDLIRGLIRGVKNLAGNLAGAIKDVASGAVDAAKDFLGIHSPSTVFTAIGEQVGQGFVNGISAMDSAAGRATRQMAAAAVGAVAGVTVPTTGAAALTGITQPFGASGTSSLSGGRTTRQGSAQAVPAGNGGPAVVNNFTINEVGDAEVTAQRVINRMVTGAGTFLL